VLFITHDLDEAIAMSDRVVVLMAFALLLDSIVGRAEKKRMKWPPKVAKLKNFETWQVLF